MGPWEQEGRRNPKEDRGIGCYWCYEEDNGKMGGL